jgi:PAS domain S-box-containing protein
MGTSTLAECSTPKATAPLHVLILEDTQNDVDLILLELRKAGLHIEHTLAGNKEQFRRALQQEDFDAIVSDYRLPNWTGLKALREVRETDRDIPFVLVTRTLGEEAAVECMKQGATDYILKDHISRLPAALKRALNERQLREEARQTQTALAESETRSRLQFIADRELTEEALNVSEARNRDLVEHSIYGISRVAADGSFLDENAAMLSILGCTTAEELYALNLMRDVFRFPEQHATLMAACREHGQVHGAESEWRRRDGGIVAVRLHVRLLSIPNHSGAVEIMAEDVTELRAMEWQLRQAQKFEAIGQLAGGVAHDFNNVVGAILGWAELGLEQNRANSQVSERFARIREQAERAAALTRELLAFARRQVLRPQAVDINAIISGLVSFLDKVISRDIELKVITAAVAAVKADPTQLEQVLMNLCLNARDAMPKGGRLLIETEMVQLDDSYCRFYPYVTPGRYAVLSVSDTGMGMDPETRERIFEPFFTTKGQGKGTGMGLATAYGIVKQHGGFIHVHSEPGHGSLFRVYLPAHQGLVAEGSSAREVPPPQIEIGGSETILIAEDHESIREMARQALLKLGYRVLSACDGEEALKLCAQETPALAILDVIMPKLGGPAVASKLKTLFAGLPVLFTSGYSQDSEDFSSVIVHARFLQKPYSPTTLGRLVREILNEAKDKILKI